MNVEQLMKLLQKYGVQRVTLRGHNISACCPFHPENRPSWGITITPPHVHGCFSCGAKGTLYTLLRHFGVSDAQAKIYAEDTRRREIFPLPDRSSRPVIESMSEDLLYPHDFNLPVMRQIAQRRGVPVKLLRKLGCLYHKADNRILFPWYMGDDLVGITGRSLDPYNPVRIQSYGVSAKGKSLYLPGRRITKGPLIVVEGEFDAIKVYFAGYRNVGALGAGVFTEKHARQILDAPCEKVVAFFDDDHAGERITQRVKDQLSCYKSVCAVSYEGVRENFNVKVDPCELSVKQVKFLVEKALTFNL